jgi:hypothetical protein
MHKAAVFQQISRTQTEMYTLTRILTGPLMLLGMRDALANHTLACSMRAALGHAQNMPQFHIGSMKIPAVMLQPPKSQGWADGVRFPRLALPQPLLPRPPPPPPL